ncbi:MAG: Peptidase E [uncultured bacterium]|uniref:Peptidase E n=1 Tax=Candidatus Woesebacteria bacterium RIFCSPHIGHO2_12_FULL_41_24 TaxID=1802510 RepID=A0A1F8ATB7_9BACT|nr:MAG: Peptidase E [uncultured bacterium]OGM14075.1 MAG: hypothetical protein A2W15_03330 [Candidatus Woesebacteria bacterium RBG_16_41_13]OGM29387.1 MAG: hypothetical protein A2873_04585 [Candidatus Woesebacteria bacterium RIFCSPHIGHO2_01_FULL_42_80]OGM34836.1 MAG: hypothetical protein A3D84_03140 [Candidatus Woesebacteria bacterium RIFCSPHIGHO2_02_FULL_42_20]OGM54465.1 MAG: hypothetical protein A3E44_00175 [Candidatus Woesebacteria bacterium RIFCSPHIGHO2_12_FULL_41_24]OGM65709.1 MAG: hypoth
MKRLFLTSAVHGVAHDIAKRVNLSKGNKLVFIDTAAEVVTGNKNWLKKDRRALVKAGFNITDYTLAGKKKSQLEKDLASFDYIYLSGGDTFYLLEQSQKSGFASLVKDLVLKRGKTYIGTSAGSIIAGEMVPGYLADKNLKLKNRNGYGFVNFTIMPHWGDPDFKDRYLKTRLKTVYKKGQGPFILLTNNQYIHVQDKCVEIINITK